MSTLQTVDDDLLDARRSVPFQWGVPAAITGIDGCGTEVTATSLRPASPQGWGGVGYHLSEVVITNRGPLRLAQQANVHGARRLTDECILLGLSSAHD